MFKVSSKGLILFLCLLSLYLMVWHCIRPIHPSVNLPTKSLYLQLLLHNSLKLCMLILAYYHKTFVLVSEISCLKFLNRLYDIAWFRAVYAKWFMKSVICSKPGYTSSKISNISYNLIFTTNFNDSLILITIISSDYLNLSLVNEYDGDVTIPIQAIKYEQNFLQMDQPIRLQYSNQIKLFLFNLRCISNCV